MTTNTTIILAAMAVVGVIAAVVLTRREPPPPTPLQQTIAGITGLLGIGRIAPDAVTSTSTVRTAP